MGKQRHNIFQQSANQPNLCHFLFVPQYRGVIAPVWASIPRRQDQDKGQLRKKKLTLLNTELNPICHLLALLGAHHILHVSRIRVNLKK